jgi:hypothetical protein
MNNEYSRNQIRKPNVAVSNKSAILRNISGYAGGPDISEDAADYVSTRFQKAVRLA